MHGETSNNNKINSSEDPFHFDDINFENTQVLSNLYSSEHPEATATEIANAVEQHQRQKTKEAFGKTESGSKTIGDLEQIEAQEAKGNEIYQKQTQKLNNYMQKITQQQQQLEANVHEKQGALQQQKTTLENMHDNIQHNQQQLAHQKGQYENDRLATIQRQKERLARQQQQLDRGKQNDKELIQKIDNQLQRNTEDLIVNQANQRQRQQEADDWILEDKQILEQLPQDTPQLIDKYTTTKKTLQKIADGEMTASPDTIKELQKDEKDFEEFFQTFTSANVQQDIETAKQASRQDKKELQQEYDELATERQSLHQRQSDTLNHNQQRSQYREQRKKGIDRRRTKWDYYEQHPNIPLNKDAKKQLREFIKRQKDIDIEKRQYDQQNASYQKSIDELALVKEHYAHNMPIVQEKKQNIEQKQNDIKNRYQAFRDKIEALRQPRQEEIDDFQQKNMEMLQALERRELINLFQQQANELKIPECLNYGLSDIIRNHSFEDSTEEDLLNTIKFATQLGQRQVYSDKELNSAMPKQSNKFLSSIPPEALKNVTKNTIINLLSQNVITENTNSGTLTHFALPTDNPIWTNWVEQNLVKPDKNKDILRQTYDGFAKIFEQPQTDAAEKQANWYFSTFKYGIRDSRDNLYSTMHDYAKIHSYDENSPWYENCFSYLDQAFENLQEEGAPIKEDLQTEAITHIIKDATVQLRRLAPMLQAYTPTTKTGEQNSKNIFDRPGTSKKQLSEYQDMLRQFTHYRRLITFCQYTKDKLPTTLKASDHFAGETIFEKFYFPGRDNKNQKINETIVAAIPIRLKTEKPNHQTYMILCDNYYPKTFGAIRYGMVNLPHTNRNELGDTIVNILARGKKGAKKIPGLINKNHQDKKSILEKNLLDGSYQPDPDDTNSLLKNADIGWKDFGSEFTDQQIVEAPIQYFMTRFIEQHEKQPPQEEEVINQNIFPFIQVLDSVL